MTAAPQSFQQTTEQRREATQSSPDIVERLRTHFGNTGNIKSTTFDLLKDAADEIERLRHIIILNGAVQSAPSNIVATLRSYADVCDKRWSPAELAPLLRRVAGIIDAQDEDIIAAWNAWAADSTDTKQSVSSTVRGSGKPICQNCGDPIADGTYCGMCREMGCTVSSAEGRTP